MLEKKFLLLLLSFIIINAEAQKTTSSNAEVREGHEPLQKGY